MEDQIVHLFKKRKEGLTFQKIWRELRLSREERNELQKSLKILENQGTLRRIKKRYFLSVKSNRARGKFVASPRGYGFVIPEGGFMEDIFIPARYSGGALEGDMVEVVFKEKGKKGKPEGRVIKIIKKEKERIIGLYSERYGQPFFSPFDSPSSEEIPLASKEPFSPLPGMIVEVDRESLEMRDILGMPDDPGVDLQVVIRRYNLASSFRSETQEEIKDVSSKISPQDERDRKDYRALKIVTIDGEKAQDFDDAVSVERLSTGNFHLGVHIADVSHYVKPGTSLDQEAFERGTSVYFPDLTLPMLPEKLSNNICSLRPKEERLTFSVFLEIDKTGKVLKTEFHPSLIKTSERMTYTSVYKIFECDEKEMQKYSHLVSDLLLMRELARLLRKKREEEGSLNFDLIEAELVYKEGRLHSVAAFEQNEAHQVIEEFMVAANEAVASYLSHRHIPTIYRVHPAPAIRDLEKLREVLAHFGISLPKPSKVESKDLGRVLKMVDGKPEEKFINIQVLRSLKLAVYSEENYGHYGLAKREYTHFTSPIRRYPDLVVHRTLKRAARGEKVKIPSLSSVALLSSEQERKADEAEKALVEWRIFRFLKGKLGDEFEGMIVDITKAGLVVELDDYFVDGILSYADLGGDYYYKKSERILIGKRTGKKFELGDRIKVILASIDPLLRRMSFILSATGGENF